MANIFKKTVTAVTAPSSSHVNTLEIPFDLNSLFSLQYEFKPLKEVIEYIFGELKKNGDKIHAVDTKLVSKFMQIEK